MGKLYTKQEGCHGVGQDLELYIYVFLKKNCHHSTGKELVFLVNVCSQGGQEYLTETVWTSCHWGSWRTSPCHVPRRGKADVGGVVSPLTHGPCEHSRPEKIKKKMLESRSDDALVLLVKLVKIYFYDC